MEPPDLCIRITLPYQDCSGVIQQWYTRCAKAVCYEHAADEKVSQTHVHLALIGLDCKEEALKRMWKQAPGSGNKFWSMTPIKEESKYLAYMTKGKLTAKSAKNFSHEELETHRLAWVDPVKDASNVEDSPMQFYITQVIDMFDYIHNTNDLPDRHPKDGLNLPYDLNQRFEWLFYEVRSATIKTFLRRNNQMPHATQYKTVASTVFMKLCKKINQEDQGISVLLNSWY